MVAQLPADAQRVVELGGGTGVFTRALLDRGNAPRDLLVVELNEELAQLLKQRFADVRIVNGDACELPAITRGEQFAEDGVDAVVSGLGFLSMPRSLQKAILEAVFAVLGPERPLIQFTYGPSNPLPRELLSELGIAVRRASVVLLNVPPATVYVYTRTRSTPVRAVRASER
jgi:phospholipid N-methyltransferase